jgi:hypothetical protein
MIRMWANLEFLLGYCSSTQLGGIGSLESILRLLKSLNPPHPPFQHLYSWIQTHVRSGWEWEGGSPPPIKYNTISYWKGRALKLMYIKLPMYLCFYMVLGLNDFDAGKSITQAIGWGGP